MKESILLSGPGTLAGCQVYLAILVALSCPFYVPLGMSAAITLPSNPCIFTGRVYGVRRGPRGQTGGKVFMTEANHRTHTFVLMRKQGGSQRLTVLSLVWHVVNQHSSSEKITGKTDFYKPAAGSKTRL